MLRRSWLLSLTVGGIVPILFVGGCTSAQSGPVVPVVFDGPTSDLPQVAVSGAVELRDGCLYFESDREPTSPIVWPAGTTWNGTDQTVVFPGGRQIELGQPVDLAVVFVNDETELWPEIARLQFTSCELDGQDILVAASNRSADSSTDPLVSDDMRLSDLNEAVKAFLSERIADAGIQIEYSVGISYDTAPNAPIVIVGIPDAARQREEVARLEEQLRAFVNSFLTETSSQLSISDVFEIQTKEMQPPG